MSNTYCLLKKWLPDALPSQSFSFDGLFDRALGNERSMAALRVIFMVLFAVLAYNWARVSSKCCIALAAAWSANGAAWLWEGGVWDWEPGWPWVGTRVGSCCCNGTAAAALGWLAWLPLPVPRVCRLSASALLESEEESFPPGCMPMAANIWPIMGFIAIIGFIMFMFILAFLLWRWLRPMMTLSNDRWGSKCHCCVLVTQAKWNAIYIEQKRRHTNLAGKLAPKKYTGHLHAAVSEFTCFIFEIHHATSGTHSVGWASKDWQPVVLAVAQHRAKKKTFYLQPSLPYFWRPMPLSHLTKTLTAQHTSSRPGLCTKVFALAPFPAPECEYWKDFGSISIKAALNHLCHKRIKEEAQNINANLNWRCKRSRLSFSRSDRQKKQRSALLSKCSIPRLVPLEPFPLPLLEEQICLVRRHYGPRLSWAHNQSSRCTSNCIDLIPLDDVEGRIILSGSARRKSNQNGLLGNKNKPNPKNKAAAATGFA